MIINGTNTNLNIVQINVRQNNPSKSSANPRPTAQEVALALLVLLNYIAKVEANNSTSTSKFPDNFGDIIVSCAAGMMLLICLCHCICDRCDSDEELCSNKKMNTDMQQRNNVLRRQANSV